MSKKKDEQTPKKNNSLLVGLVSALIIILCCLLGYIVVQKVGNYKDGRNMMKILQDYQKKDGLSLVYFMRTGCEFCALQEPILEELSESFEFDYLTIDSSKLSNKDKQKAINELEIEGRTPTLIILKNGTVQAIQEGFLDAHKLVEFFVREGFLDDGSVYVPEENLTFVDYEKIQELKKSDEYFTLTIGTSICDYAKVARPRLSNISKAYGAPMYYLNLNYLTRELGEKFLKELKEMGYDEEKFLSDGEIGTPLTLIIKDNKVVARLEGLKSTTEYVKFFKEHKIIAE